MMMPGMLGIAATTLCFVFVDLGHEPLVDTADDVRRGCVVRLVLIPIQTATYATMKPQEMGRASAIFNANRQVAASFGVALIATILSSRLTATTRSSVDRRQRATGRSPRSTRLSSSLPRFRSWERWSLLFINDREASADDGAQRRRWSKKDSASSRASSGSAYGVAGVGRRLAEPFVGPPGDSFYHRAQRPALVRQRYSMRTGFSGITDRTTMPSASSSRSRSDSIRSLRPGTASAGR